jgi:hypothetical protein
MGDFNRPNPVIPPLEVKKIIKKSPQNSSLGAIERVIGIGENFYIELNRYKKK